MNYEAAARANTSIAALFDFRLEEFGKKALDCAAYLRAPMNRFGKKAAMPSNDESPVGLLRFGQCAELGEQRHSGVHSLSKRARRPWPFEREPLPDGSH